MRFFQRSHDFAALKRRMGQKLSRPAYSMLYNLSWSAFSYLCPSTTCSRGVRMQCFFVGRRLPRRPISSSRVLDNPPLLMFSMSNSRTHLNTTFDIVSVNNQISTYTLLAVIYYADQHFTAQIVTRDGRIWYYDGLTLINPDIQPTLEEVGSIHYGPDLQSCKGGQATAAIYARL
jgi:hypothetical protein